MRVSLILGSFNHEKFIVDAVKSCLTQDYNNLEILITDDASTDQTFPLIEQTVAGYSGPHKLIVNQNPENLFLEHMPQALKMISGDLIVLACSDDIQYPDRVSRLVEMQKRTGAVVLASAARRIDPTGAPMGHHRLYDVEPDLSLDHFLAHGDNATCFGAGLAWRRELTDTFGHIGRGARNLDFSYPLRGLLMGAAAFINAPLLDWRTHPGNMTLGIRIAQAEDRAEALQYQERFLLNRIANWHSVIEDAATWSKKIRDATMLNRVSGPSINTILSLISQWREVRHQLTNLKIGDH